MNDDEIKRLTLIGAPWHLNMLTGQDRADMLAFGRACVMAERERCAKVCADYAAKHGSKDDDDSKAQGWMMLQCAAAIRAGG